MANEQNSQASRGGPQPLGAFRVGDRAIGPKLAQTRVHLDDLYVDEQWREAIPPPKKLRAMLRRFERSLPKIEAVAEQKKYPDLAKEAKRCLVACQKVIEQLRELEALSQTPPQQPKE